MTVNCISWCWCPTFMCYQWLMDFNYCSKLAWNILHTWSWILPHCLKTACNKCQVWGNVTEVLCITIWSVLWIQTYVVDFHKQTRHLEHWLFGSILLLNSNTLCQAGNDVVMSLLSIFCCWWFDHVSSFTFQSLLCKLILCIFFFFHTTSIVEMLQSC